ncbi:hypothetical protein N9878_02245 [bacterium]|nr:hypothetical protein [bacterium]
MIVARTLDNKRLSYDGRVYVVIPDGVEAEDALAVSAARIATLEAAIERWGDAAHDYDLSRSSQDNSDPLDYIQQGIELGEAEDALRDLLSKS